MLSRLLLAGLLSAGIAAPACSAPSDIDIKVDKHDDSFHIEASFEVPVSARIVWQVLTDFDHMADIQPNLTSSTILGRSGNILQVRQEGIARFGIFTYTFASEREIRLEPRKRILARQTAGNTKHYASSMEIFPAETGTRLRYRAEMTLDSSLGRLFGRPFIEHEIAEQFAAIAAEMEKRSKAASP